MPGLVRVVARNLDILVALGERNGDVVSRRMTRAQSKRLNRVLRDDAAVVPVGCLSVEQLLDLGVVVVVKDAVAGGAAEELNGQARVLVDGRVLDVCRLGDDIFGALADECA